MMRVQNNKNYSKITQNCVNDVNSDRDLRQVEYLNLVELKMKPGNRITERDDEDNNIGYISLMGVSPVGGSGGGGDNNDNLRNSYILCNCDCKCVMDKICGRKGVPDMGLRCQGICADRCAKLCDYEFNKRLYQYLNRTAKPIYSGTCSDKCSVNCTATDGRLTMEGGVVKICRMAICWKGDNHEAPTKEDTPGDIPNIEPRKNDQSFKNFNDMDNQGVTEWRRNKIFGPNIYISDSEDLSDFEREGTGY